jgi:hypothetical protein
VAKYFSFLPSFLFNMGMRPPAWTPRRSLGTHIHRKPRNMSAGGPRSLSGRFPRIPQMMTDSRWELAIVLLVVVHGFLVG